MIFVALSAGISLLCFTVSIFLFWLGTIYIQMRGDDNDYFYKAGILISISTVMLMIAIALLGGAG